MSADVLLTAALIIVSAAIGVAAQIYFRPKPKSKECRAHDQHITGLLRGIEMQHAWRNGGREAAQNAFPKPPIYYDLVEEANKRKLTW